MDEVKETTAPTVAETPDSHDHPTLPSEGIPQPPRDAWDRVRELALQQLNRLLSHEPKVLRGDDPDAIHDIRVATRRLQQVLNLLYPQPRPREVQRLRRQLRRCRRALGEVRNCDALLQRIEQRLARKRTARREVWTAVRHYLLDRRSQGFQKALRKLSKLNLAVFYVRLRQCLGSREPAPSLHSPRAIAIPDQRPTESFHDRVAQTLQRAWSAFENQVVLSHRDSQARVIHGVRIATKRLRYLVEVVDRFEVSGSADTLGWLRKLQQHLGHWHDLQVLEQMMIEMLARPEFLRDHVHLAMGVERLILANRAAMKDHEEKYFQMTRNSSEFRRVKEWTAYLLEFPSAAFTKG